jgi:hypothetical protein
VKEFTIVDSQEFEKQIAGLRTQLDDQRRNKRAPPLNLLFRGHHCAKWRLDTTLERYPLGHSDLRSYLDHVGRILPEIKRLRKSTFPTPDDYAKAVDFACQHLVLQEALKPVYEYLVYLRHHGYPSPFLDWTQSPDVALFFAFQKPGLNGCKFCTTACETAAIYCFCEIPLRGKGIWPAEPNIYQLSSDKGCHPRHHLQKAQYTICLAENEARAERDFGSHEDVFIRCIERQDFLRKFSIPRSQRGAILRYLDSRGCNAYSLFDTDDALIETILTREEIKKG